MKANEAQMLRSRIGASVEKADFSGSALVIEAVLEQMEVKQRVLTEIEAGLSPEAILCSNTSALSITEMGAHLKHPERFAGLHFFNPVDRMPLVEIIAGEQTSNETVACLFATVKKLGKSPVVVKDVPGFLVNRILLSYMNEAARCLADGAKIDQVDQLICSFGMPMGPFELTDEVGIPVGYHVAETLYQAYGERMEIAKALDIVHKDMKMMGKRAGFGFYNWYGQEKVVNPRVESKLAPLRLGKTMVDKDIVDRCLFIMLKEAALCLEEGVVASASHLDMAMMLGTGFPPFRGGVLRYLDQYGLSRALDTFKRLEEGWGERFCPPQAIVDRVQQHRNYYGE
jgi:3-hydroxyacyl-CoA dehydrogenase/enoyl-CoA hydratase/3-hydroxybutyryl-CoA epimerase